MLIGLHISVYPIEGKILKVKVYMYMDIWYLQMQVFYSGLEYERSS